MPTIEEINALRRARDAPLRVPDPRARRGARPRPARGRPGPPPRRGEDGAPRPARACLVEGGGGASRVAGQAGLGGDPERGARRRAAPALEVSPEAVLVTGGSRGSGVKSHGASPRAVRSGSRSATCETTPPPRRRPGSYAASAPSPCSSAATSPQPHRRRGRRPRTARRARPLRRDRRHPPGESDHRQTLRLDARRKRARVPLPRPRRGAADAARLVDRRRSRASARRASSRTTSSSAPQKRPSRRSSATWQSSSRPAGSASTPSRAGWSRPVPSTTSRTASRSSRLPRATRRPPRRAEGRRRCGRLPLLPPGRDDPRPDRGRRRRLLARRMSPSNRLLQGSRVSEPLHFQALPVPCNILLQGS